MGSIGQYLDGHIAFKANKNRVIFMDHDIAVEAAEKAMKAITDTLPEESLSVVTVRYVMDEMKEILYGLNLKS